MRVPFSMAISSRESLRRWYIPKRAVAPIDTSIVIESSRLRNLDAEGLPEAPLSNRRHDDGVVLLRPFHPAEIQEAVGARSPDRAGDVRASLGPIEAESAKTAAGRTPCPNLAPEFREEAGAGRRDFRDVITQHDVIAGDEGIGEIDAEAARKVVVADSCGTECARSIGERAVSRPLLKSDGDDSLDHLHH